MPSSLSLSQQAVGWTVNVNFAARAPPGNYNLVITASSGPLTHVCAVTIQVAAPGPVPEFGQSAARVLAGCVVLALIAFSRRKMSRAA
jgi:hypothetical protein